MLLPITYLFTSNAENKKRTQFAHLHIAGKDAVAHHRNVPQKKQMKEQKKCTKNLRMSLIFSNFVCR